MGRGSKGGEAGIPPLLVRTFPPGFGACSFYPNLLDQVSKPLLAQDPLKIVPHRLVPLVVSSGIGIFDCMLKTSAVAESPAGAGGDQKSRDYGEEDENHGLGPDGANRAVAAGGEQNIHPTSEDSGQGRTAKFLGSPKHQHFSTYGCDEMS